MLIHPLKQNKKKKNTFLLHLLFVVVVLFFFLQNVVHQFCVFVLFFLHTVCIYFRCDIVIYQLNGRQIKNWKKKTSTPTKYSTSSTFITSMNLFLCTAEITCTYSLPFENLYRIVCIICIEKYKNIHVNVQAIHLVKYT